MYITSVKKNEKNILHYSNMRNIFTFILTFFSRWNAICLHCPNVVWILKINFIQNPLLHYTSSVYRKMHNINCIMRVRQLSCMNPNFNPILIFYLVFKSVWNIFHTIYENTLYIVLTIFAVVKHVYFFHKSLVSHSNYTF